MQELSTPGTVCPLKLLVCDCYEDNRWLVVRALRGAFPTADILESETEDETMQVLAMHKVAAIVVHRLAGLNHAETVNAIRVLRMAVPIVMISGSDRQAIAKESGATCFHHYDEWRSIPGVVKNLISDRSADSTLPPTT